MKRKRDKTLKKHGVKSGKKASLIFRLSAAVLSPVLFCLVLELVLWLVGYGLPSAFFVLWTYNGKRIYLPNQHFCEHFVPKELSRAPEYSVLNFKEPSTIRIFVLGGSAANGDPEPAYGFCRQLEILLNEHSDRMSFEVINAAVTSMNSFVARRIARDCAVHQPDLFIVYMGNNEVVGPYGPPTLPLGLYKSRGFINASITIKKDFRLGQLIKNAAESLRSEGRAPKQWEGMEAFLAGKIPYDDVKLQYCYNHFKANIRDIVTTAHSGGAKTLLCTVPTNMASCAPFASQHKQDLTKEQAAEWDRFFQAGRAFEQAGEFEAALGEYQKAREIDGDYADLAFCMGKCLLGSDKVQEARDMFVRARDLDALRFRADSKINDAIRSEAEALAGQGAKLLDLEAYLEQNNQDRPMDESVFVDHVHLNVRGNFLVALEAMRIIRETMPRAQLNQPTRSVNELYELCLDRMLWNVHEQYKLAMLMYTRKTRPPFAGQIDHDKELTSLRASLFQLRGTAKRNPETEDIFIDAMEKFPADVFLIRRYGDFLMQNQHIKEAIQTYRKCLRNYPFNINIRIGLAEALAGDGMSDMAVKVLTEPNTPFYNTRKEALQLVGNLYVTQGRYFEASSIFQELYRIDSHDVHILVNLASVASHMGDFTTTKQALDKALKIAPDSVPAMINMGNYYVRQERTEQAYIWFECAARADPYNYIPQFSLGMQKLNRGQVRDGLKYITESVNLKPDFVQGYQMLATVYGQFDKVDAARNYEVLRDLFTP